MDNSEFYSQLFGEETVEQMTTGETTNAARELFPRVNFRDVQDAEMVVECLRNATIAMGKKAAQNLKVYTLQNAMNGFGIPAVVFDGNNKEANVSAVIKEQTTAITQLLGMVEAVTAQIAAMYGTPDEANAKYVSELLEFVTETRDFNEAMVIAIDLTNDLTAKTEER